jgi:Fe-S cluster assembly iron-binding protein IscA
MSNAVETAFAPVIFTEGAVKELLKLKDQQEISEDFGLRVGVDGGGCSGMSYVLGFGHKGFHEQSASNVFIRYAGRLARWSEFKGLYIQ